MRSSAGRSRLVSFRQVGGEGSFCSASGDVNLRGGSELREGGKDLAGPVVDGKGVGDRACNEGLPGKRRVEPPLVEPSYELVEKGVTKGGLLEEAGVDRRVSGECDGDRGIVVGTGLGGSWVVGREVLG